MHPAAAPSVLGNQSQNEALDLDAPYSPGKPETVSAIDRWIYDAASTRGRYGAGNTLFACLEALLRCHQSKAPSGVPMLMDLEVPYSHPRYEHDQDRDFDYEPPLLLDKLRHEIDSRRAVLNALPEFVRRNFDIEDPRIRIALDSVGSTYGRWTRELEIEEASFRDRLNVISTGKSTEMAELSIRESKRVLLRKMKHSPGQMAWKNSGTSAGR